MHLIELFSSLNQNIPEVNIMAVDAQAPCTSKSSATTMLNMQDAGGRLSIKIPF